MAELPRTIAELKKWAERLKLDPKKFAVDRDVEPDIGGYYIVGSPWAIFQRTRFERFTEGFVVRCATEEEVCECFVEVVNGTYREAKSLTRRLQNEIRARIKASWRDESGEDPTEINRKK